MGENRREYRMSNRAVQSQHSNTLKRSMVIVILVMAFSAFAIMMLTPSSFGSSTSSSAGKSPNETAALKSTKWATNVTAKIGNGSWTFSADGIPASKFMASYYAIPKDPLNVSAAGASIGATSTEVKAKQYSYTLPLIPKWSSTTTSAPMGPIGVMLSGAVLYNPYEAGGAKTVATSDNFFVTSNGVTASFLDSCNSHPNPFDFHYHGLPTCLVAFATGQKVSVTPVVSNAGTTTAAVKKTNAASKKPVLVGYSFDGYGIYDNIAMNGTTIPVSALDECNGIVSSVPGYSKAIYHYVLENVKNEHSSLRCFHGVVSSAYTQALQNMVNNAKGGPPQGGPLPQTSSPSHMNTGRFAATAQSLAANSGKDALLLAQLKSLTKNTPC